MGVLKKMLGLERDGAGLPVEAKDIQFGARRTAALSDGNNFRTNRVTLAEYSDGLAGGAHSAEGLAATWACVSLIAGTVGTLPIEVFRKVDGVRVIEDQHPLHEVLHESPNFDLTTVDVWEFLAASVELRGDGFAELVKRGDGRLLSMEPLRPEIVEPYRDQMGAIRYSWFDGNEVRDVAADQMLHLRGPFATWRGGKTPLSVCRGVFRTATSADAAAGDTFDRGLRPGGIMSLDAALGREQRAELEERLQQKFAGAMNAGRPMVLDRGMSWSSISLTPEDAEMLESRKFSGEEVCRMFGTPPAMAGYGDKSSNWGTGKEEDRLGFIMFTMRKRMKRIEACLEKQLLSAGDRARGVRIKFNFEALLRADSAGRAARHESALRNKWMTINEVRALENLPPVEWGDEPIVQRQDGLLSDMSEN